MRRGAIALVAAVGLLASGPACAKKNEDKLNLEKLVDRSAHSSGVFRYTDETPASPISKGVSIGVRGLVEDDFRFKARLSVDAQDVFDEVVNDDGLAVRFLDPKYIPNFTIPQSNSREALAALAANYWVRDNVGAPPIGDAAITANVLGVDPIVDSLSVVDYVKTAIAQSIEVLKFNAERIDYRPAEDPFPRPAAGSGVTRWDLIPARLPRADAVDSTGQGTANLAKVNVFRKMAVYVKGDRVVQVREKIGADFDLVDQFRGYIERLIGKNDPKALSRAKAQINAVADNQSTLVALLNIALNQQLVAAGQDPVRFRTMQYEFSRQGEKFHADLPTGTDVKIHSLDFFGANGARKAADAARVDSTGAAGQQSTSTTASTSSP